MLRFAAVAILILGLASLEPGVVEAMHTGNAPRVEKTPMMDLRKNSDTALVSDSSAGKLHIGIESDQVEEDKLFYVRPKRHNNVIDDEEKPKHGLKALQNNPQMKNERNRLRPNAAKKEEEDEGSDTSSRSSNKKKSKASPDEGYSGDGEMYLAASSIEESSADEKGEKSTMYWILQTYLITSPSVSLYFIYISNIHPIVLLVRSEESQEGAQISC